MARVQPDPSAVRAMLPSLRTATYLNTGGCGPLPVAADRALREGSRASLHRVRGSLAAFEAMMAEAAATRAAAGRVLGAPGEQIALTANTTTGLNIVAWGLDWSPGDEIVAPALEHPGLTVPLAVIARRHGAVVRWIDPEGTGDDLPAAVARACGPRTRLVALSHVSWATGAVLDVAGVARVARAAGALVLVDGAQSVGAMPVDAAALDVDAYAFPAHKWLLGPEGLGALWVAPGALSRIDLATSGYESGSEHGPGGALTPHPNAERYEVSTPPAALLPAWRASIEWLEGLGWEWIHGRVAAAREMGRAALGEIPGVRILTPAAGGAGLLTFVIEGRDPQEACAALAARGVIIRWLERPAALRASFGFFCDEIDVQRLAEGVGAVARGDC
jgi:L-cysteine/cystine lyase